MQLKGQRMAHYQPSIVTSVLYNSGPCFYKFCLNPLKALQVPAPTCTYNGILLGSISYKSKIYMRALKL